MQRWLLACATAWSSLRSTSGAGDMDFGALLGSVDFTCALPIKEGQRLNESEAGVALMDVVFDQSDRIPEAVAGLCPEMCDAIAGDPSIPPLPQFQELCIASCLAHAPQVAESCYTDLSEAEVCSGVPPGRFCLATRRRNETEPDEPARLCVLKDNTGSAASAECLAGFYCKGAGEPPISCQKGYWCPVNSTEEQACPVGSVCALAMAAIPCHGNDNSLFNGTECKPGDRLSSTPGRTIVPKPCPRGQFCVDGTAKDCPSGHLCPAGTITPLNCLPIYKALGMCPAGRELPNRWLLDVIVTLFSVLMAALIFFLGVRLGVTNGAVSALVFFGLFGVFAVVCYWDDVRTIDHLVFFAFNLILVTWGSVVSPRLGQVTGRFQIIFDLALFAGLGIFYGVREGPSWDPVCSVFIVSLLPGGLFCYYLIADSSVRRYWVWTQLLPLALATIALLAMPVAFPLVRPYVSGVVGFLILCIVAPAMLKVFVGWFRGLASKEEKEDLRNLEQTVATATSLAVSGGATKSWQTPSVSWTRDFSGASPTQPLFARSSTAPVSQGSSAPSKPLVTELQTSPEEGFSVGRASLAQEEKTAIGITLRNLFLFLPTGQIILKDVSLTIPAGASVAVMGPSGSGKSSITNVLSGRAGYGLITGEVLINGIEGVGLSHLRGITGFVPQDDVMHRNLTVLENVSFNAELRLPQDRRVGAAWANDEALRVIERIGLSHVKDSLIGDESKRGISGGQRKRVSIAMEFVAMPEILFLDEPTSGLDSTTSHAVVDMITQFAEDSACTSIAVIHQPRFETLCLFNQVILLAAGGFLAYAGPTDKVVKYFTEELGATFPPIANPADVVMDIISLDSARAMVARNALKLNEDALKDVAAFGEFLAKTWHAAAFRYGPGEEAAVAQLPPLSVQRSSWGEAVVTQIRRALIQTKREWSQFAALSVLLTLGLFALVLGLPADQKFANVLAQPCFGLFLLLMLQGVNAQRVFGGAERVVGWREAGSGVSMIFYFAGRDIAALADIFLSSVVFTAIYWPLGPLNVTIHTMLWAIFAFTYTTWGLNYIWSVALPGNAAQMVSVVTSFVCFLLTGVQPSFSTLSEKYGGIFMMALSPIRWAFGYLISKHIETGSQFSNPMIQYLAGAQLTDMGMPIQYLDSNSTLFPDGWTCQNNPDFLYVGLRWIGCQTSIDLPSCDPTSSFGELHPGIEDLLSNSLVCSTKQLFLMGAYYRFVALVCLNLTAKAHATGGGAAVEVPDTKRSSGGDLGGLLQATFVAFIVALTYFEITLLMHTQ